MKVTVTLVAALSLLGYASATSSLEDRGKKAVGMMPLIDMDPLTSNCRFAGDEEVDMIESEDGDLEKRACPKCYPYRCNGRCCRYSHCCKKECCLPNADGCNKNGRCVIIC